MLLIFTHKTTPRLRYIFKQILKEFLGIEFGLTSKVEEFVSHKGPKMSYTKRPLGGELFFKSHKVLFEQGVNDIDISISKWEGIPIFFKTGENSAMPFDIFGASFYLLSRYEEYLPHIRDDHNRFSSEDSLAFKNDFMKLPLVDMWVAELFKILNNNFENKFVLKRKFRFESTINVSQVYKFKSKGLVRSIAGTLADVFRFRIADLYDRALSSLGLRKDPYDSFNFLARVQKKYNVNMSFFFLLANYSRYDRNISYNSTKISSFIKSIGDRAKIGLYPSYYSNSAPEMVKVEKDRLERITNFRIDRSRQHYVKIQLPETYRQLIDNEIFNDYSMGYNDSIGFRASTSENYYFYDLDFEIQTPLKIHPFVVRDYSMKDDLKYSPDEALKEITIIMKQVKDLKGQFISLFHNISLGRDEKWTGWRNVYREMVKYANS